MARVRQSRTLRSHIPDMEGAAKRHMYAAEKQVIREVPRGHHSTRALRQKDYVRKYGKLSHQ